METETAKCLLTWNKCNTVGARKKISWTDTQTQKWGNFKGLKASLIRRGERAIRTEIKGGYQRHGGWSCSLPTPKQLVSKLVSGNRLVSNYQLNAQFLYSITIYMFHYNPRHVSGSTMLIFTRTNCIITASGIITL